MHLFSLNLISLFTLGTKKRKLKKKEETFHLGHEIWFIQVEHFPVLSLGF